LLLGRVLDPKLLDLEPTSDGRTYEAGDALEEQQQAEGIGQLVQSQQIHQDHRGQAHIGSNREAEGDAVEGQGLVVMAQRHHGSG